MKLFTPISIACLALAEIAQGAGITLSFGRKSPSAAEALAANKVRVESLASSNTHSFAAGQTSTSFRMFNSIWSYLIDVNVGTPAKPFTLVFDTGSSNTWIPDKTCGSSCSGAPHSFNPNASSTWVDDKGNTMNIQYGSGSCAGVLGTDTLAFGSSLKIAKQEIGLATTAASSITSSGVDGILGMGPDSLSAGFNSDGKVLKTPISNMVANHLVTKKMFSVYFAPEPTGNFQGSNNGQVTFGGLPDSNLYSGSVQYVPLVTSGTASKYWGIPVSNIKVGNSVVVQSFDAIVDTGTTLIILDSTAASAIYKKISGSKYSSSAGLWEVPCTSLSSLPTITFTINGKSYPLTPEQYTVPSWESSSWGTPDSNKCFSYIVGENAGVQILGQKFLENYVSVYDADNKRIGFAPRAGSASVTTATTKVTAKTTTTKKVTATTKKTTTTKKATTTTKTTTTTKKATTTTKKAISTKKTTKKSTTKKITTTKKASPTTKVATATSSCTKKYTVKKGDTCYSIAAKVGSTTAAKIIAKNPNVNKSCTNLRINQVLCVN